LTSAAALRARSRQRFGFEQGLARLGEDRGTSVDWLDLDAVVRRLQLCRQGGLAKPCVMEIDEPVTGRQGAFDRPADQRDRLAGGREQVGQLAIAGHADRQRCGQREPWAIPGPGDDDAGGLEACDECLDGRRRPAPGARARPRRVRNTIRQRWRGSVDSSLSSGTTLLVCGRMNRLKLPRDAGDG